jgi:polyisoprenoid-binding protein YceI
VPIPAGTYALGPQNSTLSVRTGRTGAAAKAGHNLLMRVTAWEGSVVAGEDPADTSIELFADGSSLQVIDGTGGLQALTEDDKADIEKTIDDEVLKKQGVTFRSTSVSALPDGGFGVQGDLTLMGTTRPLSFDVALDGDDGLRTTAVIKQSDWGMKPYSALFGALKVVDEVEVTVEARLA